MHPTDPPWVKQYFGKILKFNCVFSREIWNFGDAHISLQIFFQNPSNKVSRFTSTPVFTGNVNLCACAWTHPHLHIPQSGVSVTLLSLTLQIMGQLFNFIFWKSVINQGTQLTQPILALKLIRVPAHKCLDLYCEAPLWEPGLSTPIDSCRK